MSSAPRSGMSIRLATAVSRRSEESRIACSSNCASSRRMANERCFALTSSIRNMILILRRNDDLVFANRCDSMIVLTTGRAYRNGGLSYRPFQSHEDALASGERQLLRPGAFSQGCDQFATSLSLKLVVRIGREGTPDA